MSKVGWLTKQGGSFITNWKKRFFTLDEKLGSLTYFETAKPNEKPLGVVLVRGATIAHSDKGEKGKFALSITTRAKDKVFYAYSDSKEETDDWIKKLTIVAQSSPPEMSSLEQGIKRQLLTGWLTKEAGSGRNWRKRWFILDTEYLCYYKDKKDKTPQGSIYIVGARVYTPTPPEPGNPHLLIVEPFGSGVRKYRIKASSEDEMKSWVQQISSAIALGGKPNMSLISSEAADDDDDEFVMTSSISLASSSSSSSLAPNPSSEGKVPARKGTAQLPLSPNHQSSKTEPAPFENFIEGGLFDDITDQQIYVEKDNYFSEQIITKCQVDLNEWRRNYVDLYK